MTSTRFGKIELIIVFLILKENHANPKKKRDLSIQMKI